MHQMIKTEPAAAWILRERPKNVEHIIEHAHPVLAEIYARRGVHSLEAINHSLGQLIPPNLLLHADKAGHLLADAIASNTRMTIVGDFDADGATSTALAMRGLRALGANQINFRVPDRFRDGYGLTPHIVDELAAIGTQLIITVDNGISSIEGVQRANELGIDVLVTDHHLPGEQIPNAKCIVNPNQTNCSFPSKNLAGVGVMFYVLMSTRSVLRERGSELAQVNLAQFLDIVALGTVADVVPLDQNNRILVHQGIQRIRAGQACAGVNALLLVAKKDRAFISATDLAFSIAPRINAAGRLDDMTHGILCLVTDVEREAINMATELDALNQERRHIEADMLSSAQSLLAEALTKLRDVPQALVMHEPEWHQGVIGILAGRIKDKFHRPTFCFAQAENGELKGSGRSIPGIHMRDALANVAVKHPGLIIKFGGHAMAAGLSLAATNLSQFRDAFIEELNLHSDAEIFAKVLWHDGVLDEEHWNLTTATALESAGPWGQKFPEPRFISQGIIKNVLAKSERYCKFVWQGKKGVELTSVMFDTSQFNRIETGAEVLALFSLDVNRFRGSESLQARIEKICDL